MAFDAQQHRKAKSAPGKVKFDSQQSDVKSDKEVGEQIKTSRAVVVSDSVKPLPVADPSAELRQITCGRGALPAVRRCRIGAIQGIVTDFDIHRHIRLSGAVPSPAGR